MLPDLSRLLFFQANIKLIRCILATVKKTTSKKASATRKGTGPIITAYKTLTTARTTVKTTANPISTYIDDNEDDSGDDTTDDGSGDESYFNFSGCGKCQIFGLNPSPPQITTSQMILGQILIVETGENGPDGGKQR